jgi:uncharacterized protein YutE (UPF0331/DUF86 family)
MPDKKLILQKLSEIAKQLMHLKQLTRLREDQLFGNENQMYFAERVMERLIQAAIDINMHLVYDLGGETPRDYYSSFLALAEFKILPLAFAKKIAPSTSLRNILVHDYQQIDPHLFIQGLKLAERDYRKYLEYIEKFID